VILSNSAKYSMTRSVARSLYDSWASCVSYRSESSQSVLQTPLRPNRCYEHERKNADGVSCLNFPVIAAT